MKGVNRLSRPLIYVLFVMVVVFFLSLKAERGKTIVLGKWPLSPVSTDVSGTLLIKQRADGSQVIVLKLEKAFPSSLVLIQTKDGLWRELGRLKGATFVITLPPEWHLENLIALRLVSSEERILAEVSLKQKE